MQGITTNFSANESALGYYYQIRYGLYLLLSNEGSEEKSISLETLDDIVIEDIDALQLIQTKYHVNRAANLTDRSSDFWKTMRVWCDNIKQKRVDPKQTIFTLITSSQCSDGTLMEKIKNRGATHDELIRELEAITLETSNQTNLKGYEAFRELDGGDKLALMGSIIILDGAKDFQDIERDIIKIIRLSTEPKKIPSLLERLEGWWFKECIIQLKDSGHAGITYKSLWQKINDIQDELKKDSLPLDFISPLEVSDEDVLSYEQMIFVQQLRLIATGAKTLKNAISEYHRAFQQRARWIREDLLNPSEEDGFEQRLFDDWKTLFELMEDNLVGQTDMELTDLGKVFYESYYIKRVPPIYIREKFTDPFMARGSCHMLADKKEIGWHPDFKNKF